MRENGVTHGLAGDTLPALAVRRCVMEEERVSARPLGRSFFFNPGPTNIPDRVLRAMHRPAVDFLADEFLETHRFCHERLKQLLGTRHHLFLYASTGHGAWEASFVNLFAPGSHLLMLESGHFSRNWAEMATDLGLEVETVEADWRKGVRIENLETRLREDRAGTIAAVLAVHSETSTGLSLPIAEIRRAIDAAGHDALLLVDTISSFGSMEFGMDAWGVDVTIGGSQKGLMIPTGLSFSAVSDKAMARRRSGMRRHYWSWELAREREPQRFPGTTPVHLFFALEEALKMIEEEGMGNAIRRHSRLAEATRCAVRAWSGGGGPELFCRDGARFSNSVTAVWLPEGHDADALRRTAMTLSLSLGGGLSRLKGRVFRIGHLGDLNEPMLLGALGTVELAMKLAGVPHRAGGVEAAIEYLGAERRS
jgi:alanine-glyoxylate transaminase/serine-glyoxylate transaminase/serine-pyruvate transaminase